MARAEQPPRTNPGPAFHPNLEDSGDDKKMSRGLRRDSRRPTPQNQPESLATLDSEGASLESERQCSEDSQVLAGSSES